MTRRWMHCGCIAAAAVACLFTFSAAAPVLKDDPVAAVEKPLVRTKRADEIIFNGQQEVDGARIKKSDAQATDSDAPPKTDDVSKPVTEDGSTKSKMELKSDALDDKQVAENDEQNEESNEFNLIDKPTDEISDDDEQAGVRAWDDGDDYAGDPEQRRRRRSAAASKENSQKRRERSVVQPAVAMVAENMAVPMASAAAAGGTRLQRAKRELDADEIRDLLESGEQSLAPSGDEQATLDYNEYGPASDESQDEIVVNRPANIEEPYEEEGVNEYNGDDSANYFTSDDRRPKRRGDNDENEADEEEEEEEEAYEDAEREVVRELLAERAAEETRQALLAYLNSNGEDSDRGRGPYGGGSAAYRPSDERFGEDDADDEETAYADEDEEEGQTDDEGDFNEDGRRPEEEEIDSNDDRLSRNQFLGDDGQETIDEAVEQKRFSYPYSYEPYGGRWGALVPGAKRSDRDPYDRLYRLAEALSRPSIGDDDGKK